MTGPDPALVARIFNVPERLLETNAEGEATSFAERKPPTVWIEAAKAKEIIRDAVNAGSKGGYPKLSDEAVRIAFEAVDLEPPNVVALITYQTGPAPAPLEIVAHIVRPGETIGDLFGWVEAEEKEGRRRIRLDLAEAR